MKTNEAVLMILILREGLNALEWKPYEGGIYIVSTYQANLHYINDTTAETR